MTFGTAKESEYFSALLEADTVPAVRAVMNVWYVYARHIQKLPITLVVDACMQAHDWERALRSLEDTYGRNSLPHRFMVRMLETGARQSRLLSEGMMRPAYGTAFRGNDLGRAFGR